MFVTPVPAIIDIGPTKIIQYGRQIQDGHHTNCSYLGIHQYKTPYCSHNSMKLHAYVLYVPCDTLQIISYIKFPKWPPNTLWPPRIQCIESAIFIYVCQQ